MIAISKKSSVFVITHEFFPMRGGIATYVEEMARASVDLGYEVEVWAPHSPQADDRHFPFRVLRIPLRGTQDLSCQIRMARQMIRERRRLRKGIVYLPEPGPVLAMTYLHYFKAFKPARMIITFHGTEILRFASRPAARLLVRQLIKRADLVTTSSRFAHQLLKNHFPVANCKTRLTPCALRTDFRATASTRKSVSDKVIILTVGRLHPRKGQIHILEALEHLPEGLHDRVEYWIIGRGAKGNYEARLREMADRSRVAVTFLGVIDNDDLETFYQRADIFAMTSINHEKSVEGFGQVYLEASAFGLPVVAHDVGGVSEAVCNGKTGILVEPHDRDGLTEAFAQLIGNPDLRRSLGENGRIWAHDRSWSDSARLLYEPVDGRAMEID
ncbi:MAG: glycosyltransferase family 1 protein [Verrucomicrobia bacterium]|nr:MAG: glycosyltransferase family 1 protein [Verrucomicrobiota bacterium]